MSRTISSIRIEIQFDDPRSRETVQEFVDGLLEHHPIDLTYRWEPTHVHATDQPR